VINFPFKTSGLQDESYASEIYKKLKKVPVLEPSGTGHVAYLFHLSDNPNIEHFEIKPMIFCWCDVLSDSRVMVQQITQLIDHSAFSALYAIKIGVEDANTGILEGPCISSAGIARGVIEYELNCDIPKQYLSSIRIKLIGDRFVLNQV